MLDVLIAFDGIGSECFTRNSRQWPRPVFSHDIVKDRPERKDISAAVHRFRALTFLLWSHVSRRAHHGLRPSPARAHQPFGNTPIYYEYLPEAPDHDVLRFQVAVNDAALMSECHRVTYFLKYAKTFKEA